MNKIPNKQVICEVLMEQAKEDKDIVALCSCLLYTSLNLSSRIISSPIPSRTAFRSIFGKRARFSILPPNSSVR